MADQMFTEAARLQAIHGGVVWTTNQPASFSSHLHSVNWTPLAVPTPEATVDNVATFDLTTERAYSGSTSSGTPQSSGRTTLNDFQFIKYQDAMTPKFFLKSCSGGGVDRVAIEFYKQSMEIPWMVYIFDGSNVSFHQIECDPRLPNTFIEVVKLYWSQAYIYAIGTDGGTLASTGWDARTNAELTPPTINTAFLNKKSAAIDPSGHQHFDRIYTDGKMK